LRPSRVARQALSQPSANETREVQPRHRSSGGLRSRSFSLQSQVLPIHLYGGGRRIARTTRPFSVVGTSAFALLGYVAGTMSDDPRSVECDDHGSQTATYVCHHLLDGRGAGFNQVFDPDEPDGLFPSAWCDACDDVLETEGEWNETALDFAVLRLLCSACYLKVRLLNWPRSTHTDLARLLEQSIDYLQDKQDALTSRFHLSDHDRYDWHQESGQLIFSNRGVPAVVADIQFVGSISTRSHTWMWSWANESFLEAVRSEIRRVRAYGDEHSLMKLACAYWGAEEEDGWQMAAVSAYLLKAQGAYRSPDEHGFTFMVLTDVRWAQ
jgi:hypothetical protein